MSKEPEIPYTATITVHVCQACGEHASESQTFEGDWHTHDLKLSNCERCGLLCCESCNWDRGCCKRVSDIFAVSAANSKPLF